METKKITMLVTFICLVGLSLAYYPGETIIVENDMGISDLVYAIVDNSTIVDFSVTINSTYITITFPSDMTPDSFYIVFMKENTKEVVKTETVYRGGGGGTTVRYVDRNITTYQYLTSDTLDEDRIEVIQFNDTSIIGDDDGEGEGGTFWFSVWFYVLVIIIGILLLFLVLWVYYK